MTLDDDLSDLEPANDAEREALEREWASGRMHPFGERLLAFVGRHREDILRLAGDERDASALLRAAKRLVVRAGAVDPRSEMSDQVREISDEIWIRGERGDYDRRHIAHEWTSRHAANWRRWRLKQYLFVMERRAAEIVERAVG